ncbi:MAG: type II toxin-antitoxin system Phd/YefM family antitoxin [Acidobacteriota bacterium]
MDAITYSAARANLADTMDRVCDDHDPIIVTRRNGRNVVLVSQEDWNSIEETAYLLGSPANAARLRASIANEKAGNFQIRSLIEE